MPYRLCNYTNFSYNFIHFHTISIQFSRLSYPDVLKGAFWGNFIMSIYASVSDTKVKHLPSNIH